MTERRVRVLLVDDHSVVRLGLAALFGTVGHFEVVGEAGTVAAAVTEALRCQPDVVIMDVRLPDASGIEACREIRSMCPNARVLMLTSYADEDAVVASIMAGATGYCLKQADPEQLIQAVEAVASGGSLLDPMITETVVTWIQKMGVQATSAGPLAGLSEQERRILTLIAEGKTNREIAATLYLSDHTVKSYVSNILKKLGLSRRSSAAAFIARQRQSEP